MINELLFKIPVMSMFIFILLHYDFSLYNCNDSMIFYFTVGCAQSNAGKEFVMMFLQNGMTQTSLELHLYPAYVRSAAITATISTPKYIVNSAAFINKQVYYFIHY